LSFVPDLPVKSQSTLRTLTIKRNALIGELNSWCIQNFTCYDQKRAKDFLRTYACDFFDILKDAYGGLVWNREHEVAEEAIEITIKCWDSLNVLQTGESWRQILTASIPQHLGRVLRGYPHDNETGPKPSALPTMYQAQADAGGEQQPPAQVADESPEGERTRRATLLSAYIAATGASHKKIYEAKNSGIHKPQFYEWLNGELPASSKTTKTFETFLRSNRRPIPRRSTS
jgi:hypothetical protein